MSTFPESSNQAPCRRSCFYVGGEYVSNGEVNHFADQMYVEQLDPVDGPTKPYPLILIHGLGQTGTNWLNKPDGGSGWASFFLNSGYRVYIVDSTLRGRSPSLKNDNQLVTLSAEWIEKSFTACAYYKLWPQAQLHTQWPGSGRIGDPIFDAYYASVVPSLANRDLQQSTFRQAGAALLDRIARPVILLAHSQGVMPTWLLADSRPGLVHAIVALEPGGPPFQEKIFKQEGLVRPYGLTSLPLTYSPPVTDPTKDFVTQTISPTRPGELPLATQADHPPPRQLVNLAKIPVLLVTAEASYHAAYDWATVEFLRQAGVRKTEHLVLGEQGIHGNGHMFFLEKNSDQIAFLIDEWLDSKCLKSARL